ncbi:unnamed protein product [Symbiodinium natans]|uniref:Uncharacterized protein n=1 Tax=Symbiodinium natans TaxID=878477 RepID=A0A812H0Y1_9DINO|nr:unnamed protein product [Symbiodinium natans]
MDAHFAEAAFENSTLQAQLLQKTATSSRIVIRKAGLLSLKELLYKSDAKTRARVVRRHIEACRASACWDQVFLLQSFFLKLGINKYGACFQSGARVNLTDGSMTSVGSLSANKMVWGRGRVQKFKLKERPIKFDTSDSYEGFFCNKATGFKKLTLSGGRPPFYLGRNAEVWVLKNKDPEAADALIKSDDPKEGDELITFGEAGKATGGVFVSKVEEPIAEMEMCGPEVQAPDFFVEGISVSCDPGNGQGWQLPARLLAVIALLVLC